jgi:hypothetical protein
MLLFILKSSACLAVFMLFYKLLLERESAHTFKRFYLLGALVSAILIPLITFTTYIEATPIELPVDTFEMATAPYVPEQILAVDTSYLAIILWCVYLLGVLIFSIRFGKNLYNIVKRIKQNPKFKNRFVFHVLLTELVPPHTFLNYIFFNKEKYEAHEIPKEVFLHEETHAKEKHALDILFVEVLQILFWFNPLLYFVKKDIKLNHEFLADKAVLKNGVALENYQNTLLAFSSHASEPQLANAINYSSIKKRFTLMKTHTSKTAIWVRSLILMPLLAILIYSFSSTKLVEKDMASESLIANHTARSIDINVLDNGTYEIDGITATKKTFVSVINQLHQDIIPEIRNQIINIHINNGKAVSDEAVWFIYNSVIDYGFHRMVTYNQEIIREKGNKPFAITSIDSQELLKAINIKAEQQKGASKEQIAEYNKIAKHCSTQIKNQGFVKQKDVVRLKYLYNLMTAEQRRTVEPFPDFSKLPPPPPPALESDKNNQAKKYYKIRENSDKNIVIENGIAEQQKGASKEQITEYNKLAKFYNSQKGNDYTIKLSDMKRIKYLYDLMTEEQRKSAEPFPNFPPPPPPVPAPESASPEEKANTGKPYTYDYKDENGKTITVQVHEKDISVPPPPPPPPVPADATPEQKEKYKNVSKEYYKKYKVENGKVSEREPLPPAPPIPPLDHVIDMAKKNATFYYEDKEVTSDKAIAIMKANKNMNISTKSHDSKSPKVYLSKEPIEIND